MVNISKALNSQKVQTYHKTDYANTAQKSYYGQDDQVVGEWHGKLAEDMGLTGPVSAEHFTRLSEGHDPHTGEDLVRHRIATDQSAAHRAGWDATFSAPKSVSITALVGRDERIVRAHREAVQKGLDYLERSVNARIGGANPPEHTGKWAAATFEHDTSRPVNGYSAPQLHTHAIFFNITKTEDGKAHALDPRAIFDAQKTATAIYQAELGYRLRQLGYDLDEGKGGAREIKGYTQDYLRANSSRSEQIEEVAKHLQEQGLNKAEARQRAAHSTREAKGTLPAEQIRAQQEALARQHGNQHEVIIAHARLAQQRNHREMTPESAARVAAESVTFSREKNFEREAVVSGSDLLREALRRGQDLTTPDRIERAIKTRVDHGDLTPVKGKCNQTAYTTPEMIAAEQQNIDMMKAGQNRQAPFVADSPALRARIERHFQRFQADAAKQTEPTRRQQLEAAIQNQKDAIRSVLTSQDTVQAFQGAAGTGKTTSLTVIRKELEQEGYVVRGFAPTSRAAQQLAECGAECSTLQMHLTKPQERNERPTAYFLDETSLASTKQVNQLLSRLGSNDRVVLIGDVRQHEAVEAGRAFAQLQEHGIRTARLDEIVRQRDQALLQAVKHLADGHVPAAVSMLQAQGRVSEISNERDRLTQIAKEYLKDAPGTLVVSPDNRSRAAINGIVHEELRRTGAIQNQDHAFGVLVNRQDLTGADRKWAKAYEPGNVIRYNTGSQQIGMEPGQYVTVHTIDTKANLLAVEKADGEIVTYDPKRLHGVSVYKPEERRFAVGERVQFTSPFKESRVANRELGHITKISGTGLAIKLDSGRSVHFDAKKYAHLDYGYAVTSHSSQGLTTDRVLVNVDTDNTSSRLINDRLAYVAISRARHDAHIYTNDVSKLAAALSRDVSKSSAITVEAGRSPGNSQRQSPGPNTNGRGPDQHPPVTQQYTPAPGQGISHAPSTSNMAKAPTSLPSRAPAQRQGQTLASAQDPTNPSQQNEQTRGQGQSPMQGHGHEHRVEYTEEEGFGF